MADDDIELLQQTITHGGTQAFEIVPLALKKVLVEKQWQGRLDKHGKPFTSFEAFVMDRGLNGLATTLDDLRAFCRKRDDVRQLIDAEIGPAPDHVGRGHSSDNVTPNRGNNPTYALKRLKRDRPDLAAKVIAGELSANAAAIQAGFRKQPKIICPKCGHEFSRQKRVP